MISYWQSTSTRRSTLQTLTHALIGTALAALLYPDQPITGAAIIAGSVAPDLALAPWFIINKFKSNKVMEEESPRTLKYKEISHSFYLGCLLWAFFLLYSLNVRVAHGGDIWVSVLSGNMAVFFVGVLVHIYVDGLTHCAPEYAKTDQSCLHPFEGMVPNLGQLIGIWEYRIAPGVLRPKLPEAILDVALVAIAAIAWKFV